MTTPLIDQDPFDQNSFDQDSFEQAPSKQAVANSSAQSEEQSGEQVLAGFRLQRLEVLNWGTFDKRVWSVDLAGGTALLTGGNGSGKSTLVDGLLTLLVPNRGRNYNQASGEAGKKKERNERSYVKGAFARTRSDEGYESKTKFLRDKGEISVLMAYFRDASLERDVTLAQVLWVDGSSVRKFFAIADDALKMEYFTRCQEVPLLKKTLKDNNVELFDNFSKYAQQFRKRFGLHSSKALDLFNQTVSIKQIDGLNKFVRDHMLEAADMRAKIDGLQKGYENLTISHTAIQKAREQLEALMPLTKESKKYNKLAREVDSLERAKAILPAFFAARKRELLIEELRIVEQDLARSNNNKDECDRLLAAQRQQEKDLEFAIQQDSVGQQLQAIKQKIEQTEKALGQKQAAANNYDTLATQLGLGTYSDQDSFYASRQQGEGRYEAIEAALADIVMQRDAQKIEQSDKGKEQHQLSEELVSLRSRKSQIPKRNLDIRDRLTAALGLQEADLPFVGELLQVRSEEKAWEGAIERLLRSFGLCLLVPEAHYRAVNAYVNKTDLKGRLVYYKVSTVKASPTQRALDPAKIPAKLQVKQDDTFFEWLRDRLVQQFNYVCCQEIEQFQREKRAITKAGLIKSGQGRHEKDDSSRIDNRSRYILGWNNASKIKALEEDLQAVNQQLKTINQKIATLEEKQGQQKIQRAWLQDFMRFEDFVEIDWKTTERDRNRLLEQKQQLEEGSDQLKKLETQLKAIQQTLIETGANRDQAIGDIQTLKNRQQNNTASQARCATLLATVSSVEIEAFAKEQAKKLKAYKLILESIADDESQMKDVLQERLRKREQKRDSVKTEIVKCLIKFRSAFPDATLELGSEYEDVGEYLKLKKQIEQDDLPRHEKRFKELMNEKVIISISMFKSDLEKQEEEIELAIHDLNESLREIDYTDSTYIELRCEKTKYKEIQDFRNALRSCLGDVARQSPEDNEERFERIQTQLIERFKNEDRWTRLVTDVRNWLDFSVSERYRADDAEKEHHTDSSGKSGGQKVKLAYTILASAIAYQFGLTRNDNLALGVDKSFRFVVIDEAFSRSDDSNARYAMELFKNLDLQLLVITPKDKINVIESYIDTLHFVSNSAEGDCSKVLSLSIEEFQRRGRKEGPEKTEEETAEKTGKEAEKDTEKVAVVAQS
ncbi:MAG: SbcC/MukB-like Walker B domain-containing protein [Cyanobacteria bacterium P01_A01_bin.116]